MIRQVVILAIAVIVSVNSAYLAQRNGSSFSNALIANLALWTFALHWLSSLIGSVASILCDDGSVEEKSGGKEKLKPKPKVHENALSEDHFPTAGCVEVVSNEAPLVAVLALSQEQEPVPEPEPVLVSTPPAVDLKPEERIRLNETLPAVFRFRKPKQSSDRLLTIRA